jgi:heme exporter protein B
MISIVAAVVRRDLLLAARQRGDVLNVLFFFLVVVAMFPLGVGPEMRVLRLIGPGVLWVAALLSSMISLSRLFALDHADGSLEQLMLSGQPLSLTVLGKILAHWLLTGFPLTLAAAPLSVFFDLEPSSVGTLVAALALGTPAISLLGAVGAALTLGLRGGGVLVTLLVLPLTAPVLIFGTLAVGATAGGLDPAPQLELLAGFTLACAALAPWAIVSALRISLE